MIRTWKYHETVKLLIRTSRATESVYFFAVETYFSSSHTAHFSLVHETTVKAVCTREMENTLKTEFLFCE